MTFPGPARQDGGEALVDNVGQGGCPVKGLFDIMFLSFIIANEAEVDP